MFNLQRFIDTCMLNSVLVRLMWTTSNVNPHIFVRNVLRLPYLFY